jgi:hypothetical protein
MRNLHVFIFFLVIALGVILYRAIKTSNFSGKTSLAGTSNPFQARILVSCHGRYAPALAKTVADIFLKAANPKLIVVGVIHQIPTKSINVHEFGNIVNELRILGFENYLPNVRVSLLNSTNEYASYSESLVKLHTEDEPFCAFLAEGVTLPMNWDVMCASLYESPSQRHGSNNIVLTATPGGDFPVCAGSIDGIPYFETRKLAFGYQNLAVPIISVWTSFMFTISSIASSMFLSGVTTELPTWVTPAALASRLYELGTVIVSLSEFELLPENSLYYPAHHQQLTPFDHIDRKLLVSDRYLEHIGWDFEKYEPSPRGKLGLMLNAMPLEKRLKWGDESNQDHGNNIANGIY